MFDSETKTQRMYVYVGPKLLRAIDERAQAERRDRSEWARLVLERAVQGS